MSRHIQVYVPTENDAENLATSLKKYSVSNVTVERIPDQDLSSDFVIVPAASIGNVGAGHQGHPSMFASLHSLKEQMTADNQPSPDYVVGFSVEEDQRSDVMQEIKQVDNAYLDKEEAEES
ncbi:hypothetical protein [Alkalicoccus chagannorensis]|uniref:hypothetical protein n=1 Tax=Alkalicoccus chagannorensis TaxID=427072 RepID=UPI00040F631F|nr:hypothetical protein [Alkalicoccus chagannorensis]